MSLIGLQGVLVAMPPWARRQLAVSVRGYREHPRGVADLADYLELTSGQAREQFAALLSRRPVLAGRQVPFVPAETLLCLAASLVISHRRFGGTTAHLAPEPVPCWPGCSPGRRPACWRRWRIWTAPARTAPGGTSWPAQCSETTRRGSPASTACRCKRPAPRASGRAGCRTSSNLSTAASWPCSARKNSESPCSRQRCGSRSQPMPPGQGGPNGTPSGS